MSGATGTLESVPRRVVEELELIQELRRSMRITVGYVMVHQKLAKIATRKNVQVCLIYIIIYSERILKSFHCHKHMLFLLFQRLWSTLTCASNWDVVALTSTADVTEIWYIGPFIVILILAIAEIRLPFEMNNQTIPTIGSLRACQVMYLSD